MDYFFDEKNYLAKFKPKNNDNFFIFVPIVIILLLGLAVFLNQQNKTTYNFYFIEIENVLNYSKANTLAQQLQTEGEAGFIYFDGSYHVFSKFCLDEKSADTELKNAIKKYPLSKLFKFSTTPKTLSKLSKKQSQSAKEISAQMSCLVNKISTLNFNFVSGTSTLVETKLGYVNLYENFSKIKDEFKNLSKHELAENMKTYLENISSDLSSLTKEDEINKTNLQFYLADIVINYNSFLECF